MTCSYCSNPAIASFKRTKDIIAWCEDHAPTITSYDPKERPSEMRNGIRYVWTHDPEMNIPHRIRND